MKPLDIPVFTNTNEQTRKELSQAGIFDIVRTVSPLQIPVFASVNERARRDTALLREVPKRQT